jgi:hypothetical protein
VIGIGVSRKWNIWKLSQSLMKLKFSSHESEILSFFTKNSKYGIVFMNDFDKGIDVKNFQI